MLIDYILTGRFMSIITYKHDDRLTEYRNTLKLIEALRKRKYNESS